MFYVYILFSQGLQRYYVGSTQAVEKRLQEHNSGRSLSTRAGLPWELVHVESFTTRPQAVHYERKIKARGISRHLADIKKNRSG